MNLLKERSLLLLSLVCIAAAWELTARVVGLGDTYPPPSRVAPELWELVSGGGAFGPLSSTLQRSAAAFAVAFAIAIAYGLLTRMFPRFDDYTRGLVNISMFTPTLIVIFLGLAMLGQTFSAVVIIVVLCIFAEIGTYMRDAFQNFDGELMSMANSYKVGTRQRVTQMYLPFLTPQMLATSRIGFTLAWKITFLCEVFGFTEGLGWQVRLSYRTYDMPMLLAWLTVFIVMLLIIEQLIRSTERAVVKWRAV